MRHGGTTPVVVSSSSTAESSSMEWESPVHGWHDLKKNKYKMALRNRFVTDIFPSDSEINIQNLHSAQFLTSNMYTVSHPLSREIL